MPLGTALPYGLRDVKVSPIVAGVAGTAVDLPNARTFSFEEAEDFDTLEGDDKIVATRGKGASVNWSLESGGISFEAYVVMNGGTLVSSGTGLTEVKTYSKKSTDARPTFQVEGQVLSEGGGDIHCILPRCKADGGISGEFGFGTFYLTSASGTAIGTAADDTLYTMKHNATTTVIA